MVDGEQDELVAIKAGLSNRDFNHNTTPYIWLIQVLKVPKVSTVFEVSDVSKADLGYVFGG